MSRVKFRRVSRPAPPPLSHKVRQAIVSFDTIDAIGEELRAAVERNHPDLESNLPPKRPPAPSRRHRN